MILQALARGLRAVADWLDPRVLSPERVDDLRDLAEARRLVDMLEMRAAIIRRSRYGVESAAPHHR